MCVGFMVDKMALGWVSLHVQHIPDLPTVPLSIIRIATKICIKNLNSHYYKSVVNLLKPTG